MSKQDDLKRAAAEAAFDYVREGEYLGVGTGSTVNHFIDVLAERAPEIPGCVSSSKATTEKLRAAGFVLRSFVLNLGGTTCLTLPV